MVSHSLNEVFKTNVLEIVITNYEIRVIFKNNVIIKLHRFNYLTDGSVKEFAINNASSFELLFELQSEICVGIFADSFKLNIKFESGNSIQVENQNLVEQAVICWPKEFYLEWGLPIGSDVMTRYPNDFMYQK